MISSIAFPDMLGNTRTNVLTDDDATSSNLRLLLKSIRKSLYGDPYYGTDLKQVIFSQNGQVVQDLIVDEIYTAINTFMPQLSIDRKNIVVTGDGKDIYATFTATNLLNYSVNLYDIKLTNNEFDD